MISYRPFWETLNKRNISTYELIYRQGVSANTIYRMKRGMPITTKTLNDHTVAYKTPHLQRA